MEYLHNRVPTARVTHGQLDPTDTVRVEILDSNATDSHTQSEVPTTTDGSDEGPPVEQGEIIDVEIESLGDQGDGMVKVGPGYVIIVPETTINDRVSVRITDTKYTVAFAEVVSRLSPRE